MIDGLFVTILVQTNNTVVTVLHQLSHLQIASHHTAVLAGYRVK